MPCCTEHFTRDELQCHCGCGGCQMDERFLERLEALRQAFGAPLRLSSAWRCPDYNERISATGRTGPHTTGHAVDVLISGKDAYRLIHLALSLGFTGIGISQHGPHEKRFIHLDDLTDGPRPWVWSY